MQPSLKECFRQTKYFTGRFNIFDVIFILSSWAVSSRIEFLSFARLYRYRLLAFPYGPGIPHLLSSYDSMTVISPTQNRFLSLPQSLGPSFLPFYVVSSIYIYWRIFASKMSRYNSTEIMTTTRSWNHSELALGLGILNLIIAIFGWSIFFIIYRLFDTNVFFVHLYAWDPEIGEVGRIWWVLLTVITLASQAIVIVFHSASIIISCKARYRILLLPLLLTLPFVDFALYTFIHEIPAREVIQKGGDLAGMIEMEIRNDLGFRSCEAVLYTFIFGLLRSRR